MSRSRVVDQMYRLQAKDVGATAVAVTICNVSFQGLEQLTPLLHFDVYPGKVLTLDHQHCEDLMRLTGSALCSEWIGHKITLRTTQHHGVPKLVIDAALTTKTHAPVQPIHTSRHSAAYWSTFLLLVILGVALAAAYLLEHLDHLW